MTWFWILISWIMGVRVNWPSAVCYIVNSTALFPQCATTDLVVFRALVSTLAADCNGFSPVMVVCALELLTPVLDDVGHALNKDSFYALIEFGYPMDEVRVTFQIETINLHCWLSIVYVVE